MQDDSTTICQKKKKKANQYSKIFYKTIGSFCNMANNYVQCHRWAGYYQQRIKNQISFTSFAVPMKQGASTSFKTAAAASV